MTGEEAPNPNRGMLDEIHRLRGHFLSEVAEVEGMLNLLIRLYFDVPKRRNEEFTSWVLSTISFANKIELVGRITRSGAPDSTMKHIVSWLKNLAQWRNEMAHAQVDLNIGPNQTISEAIRDLKWASGRWTRAGRQTAVLQTEQLEHQVRSAHVAGLILFTIASEMAKRPDRLVPVEMDWRVAYNDSLNEDGIPTISKELFDYFELVS